MSVTDPGWINNSAAMNINTRSGLASLRPNYASVDPARNHTPMAAGTVACTMALVSPFMSSTGA